MKFTTQKVSFKITQTFCLVFIGSILTTTRAEVDPDLSKALQRTLDSIRVLYNLTGVSAAMVMPDKEEWVGVSGMSNPASQENMLPEMLLGIGSITKTFISAIVLQLASENKLTLEDHLYKWLPKYPNIDSTITIKQLLNHTSGIYNYTDNNQYFLVALSDLSRKFTPEEILSFVGTPSFAAGTNWAYSNTNYILLGMIIKKVTGSELSEELHKRILSPFGLNSTFLDVEDTIAGQVATCWTSIFGGNLQNFSMYPRTAVYSSAWAAGGMLSTAIDLATWVRYLYGGEVLQKEYLDQMLDFSGSYGNDYGLGTFRNSFSNRILWGHSGGIPGYVSYAGYSNQDTLSIAVLLNQDNKDPILIASYLFETAINFVPTVIKDIKDHQPEFYLSQNYPNPFNPSTTINYQLPTKSQVSLKVFDVLGNEIVSLVNQEQNAGSYEVKFSAEGGSAHGGDAYKLSSGIYLYRIQVENQTENMAGFIETNKMMFIK
jgi:D-alanyl-D-alanine carboxypeptidase